MKTISLLSVDSRSLETYLNELSGTQKLSGAEASQLARMAQAGDGRAAEKMAKSMQKLVLSCALKYQKKFPQLDLEDMVQDGNYGLTKAIQTYKEGCNASFATYASRLINNAICDGLETTHPCFKLPRYAAEQQKKLSEQERMFEKDWGRLPSNDELATLMGTNRDAILNMRELMNSSIIDIDADAESADFAYEPDRTTQDWYEDMIEHTLRTLSPREQMVISDLYGLNGPELTAVEVADKMGVTPERVRQIRMKGEQRIRQQVHYLIEKSK